MAEKNSKSKTEKETLETTSKKTTTKTTENKTKSAATSKADSKSSVSKTKTTAPKAENTATKDTNAKGASAKSTAKTDSKSDVKTATNTKVAKESTKTAVAKQENKATASKANTSATKADSATAKIANAKVASAKSTAKADSKSDVKTATNTKVAKDNTKATATKPENKATASKTTSINNETKAETKPVSAKSSAPKKAENNNIVFKEINSKTGKVENNTGAKDKVKVQESKSTSNAQIPAKNSKITADSKNKKSTSKQNANNEILATKENDKKQNKPLVAKKSKPAKSNNNKSTPKMSFKDKMVAFVASISDKNTAKDKNQKNNSNNSNEGKKAITIKNIFTDKKMRLYAITALALFLLFILILSISLGVVAKNKDTLPGGSNFAVKDTSLGKGSAYDYEYRTTAAAGYYAKVLGTVERNIPTTTQNQGIVTNPSMYPKYGYTPSGINETYRSQLIQEAWQLCSVSTRIGSDGFPRGTYNAMDKDGNLIMKTLNSATNKVETTPGNPSKLYKHTCAEGMYYGNVSDDEQAIIKQMTFNPRSFHTHGMYNVTGLYAPAGEVIKVEISEKDMDATGGITIHIGQALYNSKANNIWLAKGQMQRFPVILNTMVVNKTTAEYDADKKVYTAYVGSFLGGPIYVRNANTQFTTTISGAVAYSHFILGYTTPEEFDANKDSTAPYFDLEVWDNGVLHSGPKIYAQNFSYDDLFKVAVLWDQITSVTTTGNNQNIVFLYDPFVAAGAAVAFPGQYSVNCPAGWMSSSLNYESLIKNGAWGNFHEYHHNFQGYGVGNGGEVTNNALTLVSYALFTKISSKRGLSNFGAYGLGGWERYTSATWALDQVKRIGNSQLYPENGPQGLSLYATLLHNFGADAFMQVRKLGGGQSYANYFKKWEQVTHNNMTYYFTEMLKTFETDGTKNPLTAEWAKENSHSEYPMFVPVSCVYQTGRSYNYDNENKYFTTMQPYVIAYGQKFTIDLSKYTIADATPRNNTYTDSTYVSGSIVIPEGFSYKIIKVTQPENGTITKESDYIYHFTPNKDLQSGKIYVTLQITKDDHAFEVQNVDLVLEFQQSHDLTGRMLERTTYEFDSTVNAITDIVNDEGIVSGYNNKIESDNKNSVQNSNTDIWLTADELNAALSKNSVMEVRGKLYITETGRYRFSIRGRHKVALYLSFDNGKTYKPAASYTHTTSNTGFPNSTGTYYDTTNILQENTWVYFKEFMIVDNYGNKGSFVGLGMGKIPDPRPDTDSEGNPKVDSEGNPLPDIQDPPTIGYANAYRQSYAFVENTFETDYFYTKTYYQSYVEDEKIITTKQTVIDDYGYEAFNNNSSFGIENICDGNLNTNINTKAIKISADNPFKVAIKLDEPITANKFRIHYSKKSSSAFIGSRPKDYTLAVKLNESDEWTTILDIKNSACANYMHTATFDKDYTFQYYKLEVTDTYYLTAAHDRFMVIHNLEFISQLELSNGSRTSVGDNKIKLYGTWNIEKIPSKFGRVYVGKANSSMEFTYTGERLILFSSTAFDTNFEVYIDGKKISSIDIKESSSNIRESFISPELENKQHIVVIKCLGEANIESIVKL